MQKVKIKMLGGLSIKIDETEIVEENMKFKKHWILFVYLISHRHMYISNETLISNIWNDECLSNPINTLKNCVYNLRKNLSSISKDCGNLIIYSNGLYHWNNDVDLYLDIEHFESLYTNVFDINISDSERLSYCKDIMKIYKGDFIPQLNYEQWGLQFSIYYRKKFTEVALKYCELLMNSHNYNEVLSTTNFLTFLDPYNEDMYVYMFKAMEKMKLYTAIINKYSLLNDKFQKELNVGLSETIKNIYNKVLTNSQIIKDDILLIKEELSELSKTDNEIEGAFYCSYDVFKEVYQLMSRSFHRDSNNSILIILLTLTDVEGNIPKDELLSNAMNRFNIAINTALRKGDIFSKYSKSQYILMLSVNDIENAHIITNRIYLNFYPFMKKYSLKMTPRTSLIDKVK